MATSDRRWEGLQFPVARYEFGAVTITAAQTTAGTATLSNISGTVRSIEIVISQTEDNINYKVAITSSNSGTLFEEEYLADNQTHFRYSESRKGNKGADFSPFTIMDTLTCTITPSAAPDAGAVGTKTATVNVILYMT